MCTWYLSMGKDLPSSSSSPCKIDLYIYIFALTLLHHICLLHILFICRFVESIFIQNIPVWNGASEMKEHSLALKIDTMYLQYVKESCSMYSISKNTKMTLWICAVWYGCLQNSMDQVLHTFFLYINIEYASNCCITLEIHCEMQSQWQWQRHSIE